VKRSTNLEALYGELGRVPLIVIRKLRMVKYWIKILNSPHDSVLYKTYEMLKIDADNSTSYNGRNWAFQLKELLQEHGLSNVWDNQGGVNYSMIKQRIFDMYYQQWYSSVTNSSKLQTYSSFKQDFRFEKYLDNIGTAKFRIALTKFRVSSHQLSIETGRYHNIPQSERKCRCCQMNVVETEYHFLLVCPMYRELRGKYFKPYFCHWPTLNKFEKLMSSSIKSVQLNLAKYIYFANLKRNTVH
jgi:hypothetical protein